MKKFFYTSAFIAAIWAPSLQASNIDKLLDSYQDLTTNPHYNRSHDENIDFLSTNYDIDFNKVQNYINIYENCKELGIEHLEAVEQVKAHLNALNQEVDEPFIEDINSIYQLKSFLETYIALLDPSSNAPWTHEDAINAILGQSSNINHDEFQEYTDIYQNLIADMGHNFAADQVMDAINGRFEPLEDDITTQSSLINMETAQKRYQADYDMYLALTTPATLDDWWGNVQTQLNQHHNEWKAMDKKTLVQFLEDERSRLYGLFLGNHRPIKQDHDSFSGSPMEKKLYQSTHADLDDEIFQTEKEIGELEKRIRSSSRKGKVTASPYYNKLILEKRLAALKEEREVCQEVLKTIEARYPLYQMQERLEEMYLRASAKLEEKIKNLYMDIEEQKKLPYNSYGMGPEKNLDYGDSPLDDNDDDHPSDAYTLRALEKYMDILPQDVRRHLKAQIRATGGDIHKLGSLLKNIEMELLNPSSNVQHHEEPDYPPLDSDDGESTDPLSTIPLKTITHGSLYGDSEAARAFQSRLSGIENSLLNEDTGYKKKLKEVRGNLKMFLNFKRLNKDEKSHAKKILELIQNIDPKFSNKSLPSKEQKNFLDKIEETVKKLFDLRKQTVDQQKKVKKGQSRPQQGNYGQNHPQQGYSYNVQQNHTQYGHGYNGQPNHPQQGQFNNGYNQRSRSNNNYNPYKPY